MELTQYCIICYIDIWCAFKNAFSEKNLIRSNALMSSHLHLSNMDFIFCVTNLLNLLNKKIR